MWRPYSIRSSPFRHSTAESLPLYQSPDSTPAPHEHNPTPEASVASSPQASDIHGRLGQDPPGSILRHPQRKTIDLEGRIVKDGIRKALRERQAALAVSLSTNRISCKFSHALLRDARDRSSSSKTFCNSSGSNGTVQGRQTKLPPCQRIKAVPRPTVAQRVAYPLSGSTGIECVKSTWPIRATTPASPFRNRGKFSVCVVLRLAYDPHPHPIPGGLLPRRHLRRFSGIFPHVADREPLGLDLLLHFLLSYLECIRFRRLAQVFSWRIYGPEVRTGGQVKV